MRAHMLTRALVGVGFALACASACAQATRYLEPVDSHDWALRVRLNIRAWQQNPATYKKDKMPEIDHWAFDSAAVVFPAILATGSSESTIKQVKGSLSLNDVLADDAFEEMGEAYHSGTKLLRWDVEAPKADDYRLDFEAKMSCWRTVFHEEEAMKLKWPDVWSTDAASTFQPQMFVDLGPDEDGVVKPFDMAVIEDLVKEWMGGRDPKTQPPVLVAKWLTGQIVNHAQPQGNGISAARTGEIEGIDLRRGSVGVAKERRGNPFEITCFAAAVFREAGLPTRIVIGYDAASDKGKRDKFLERKGSSDPLRSWIEFCLVDDTTGEEFWVPVDVVRMRQSSSRLANNFMDRPLKYFGTHDELDGVLPFSFHFHPPTTVRAYGAPGFWGWFVTPEPPARAFQALAFSAITTAKTADEQRPARGRR